MHRVTRIRVRSEYRSNHQWNHGITNSLAARPESLLSVFKHLRTQFLPCPVFSVDYALQGEGVPQFLTSFLSVVCARPYSDSIANAWPAHRFCSQLSTFNSQMSTMDPPSPPILLLESCSGQTMTRPRNLVIPFHPEAAHPARLAHGAKYRSIATGGSGHAR